MQHWSLNQQHRSAALANMLSGCKQAGKLCPGVVGGYFHRWAVLSSIHMLCICLILQADNQGCCLIVTTGGTGPAPRDVTPEATEAVCSRMLPGYGEQMRAISLKYVPTAVLSRQTAGERAVISNYHNGYNCQL